jgi:isopenicillin N synthase-like dioxygenase
MHATAGLPIIDLGSEASDALRRGLVETGFFYLRDHAIPPDLLGAVREETLRFFSLPLEEKQKHEGFLRGFAALRAEDTESGFGTGEYGDGDLCEKFTMGHEPSAADRAEVPDYYDAVEAQTFFGPNVFPNESFSRVWLAYFEQMLALSRRMMAAVRTALDLPPDAWKSWLDRPADVLRFLHYPEIAADSPRMDAHYDDNLLTLLHQSTPQNGFAALQVMLPGEDTWRSVEPDDRYFVVNVGDSLMYLTEGRAIATKHRVASPPPDKLAGCARTSTVFAHLPNWNCRCDPSSPR